MKPSEAGMLLLSNCAFIGGVLGEVLPPDSIPLQCATICGPMVELSSICSGGSGKEKSLLSRRRSIAREKQKVAAERKETTTRQPNDRANLAERDFTVIVPAPTSFPLSLLVQEGTLDPPRESAFIRTRPTRIFPTEILPTQVPPPPPPPPHPASATPPPPPPPAASPTPTQQQPSSNQPTQQQPSSNQPTQQQPSSNQPTQPSDDDDDDATTEPTNESATSASSTTSTTSHAPQSSADAMDDGDGKGEGTSGNNGTKPDEDQGRWTMNNGERDCVCDNKSFNVPSVAALCSSCIAGAEGVQNDMDVIMTTCKFASEQYSPDKDKVVNNVQVQATPPKAVWGQNAGVASGGARALRPIRGVEISVGTALSLLQRWIL